ncbi:YciI family protein [Propionibacterium sp.]|uniref:YciI family protein n=1 Tax=Propionibacterium sp. TaxID=1977903 RepID=UPI0039E75AD1
MAFFAVLYTYDPAKDADAVRPRHRAYLATLYDNGLLRASGPLTNTDPVEALLIFKADDIDAATELSDSDPMVTEGIVSSRRVLAWNPVVGIFAAAATRDQKPATS